MTDPKMTRSPIFLFFPGHPLGHYFSTKKFLGGSKIGVSRAKTRFWAIFGVKKCPYGKFLAILRFEPKLFGT